MRWVIIGAGATGGYFGGQLVRAGKDVTFVARGERRAALAARGLEIYSAGGRLTIPVSVVDHPERAGEADIVVLAVKCYDLVAALEAIAPLVRSHTRVMCIQNGVEAPGMAAARYGAERVVGGLTRIEAVLLAPGIVGHFSSFAHLVLGAWRREPSDFERAAHADWIDAGVTAELSTDIGRALWEKMLGLCPLAATTAVTRVTLAEILGCPETRALHVAAIEEVAAVARAAGCDLGADAVSRTLAWHATLAPSMRASMARDLEAGRRIELNQLSGAIARMGRELGIATPVHTMIYAALRPAALAAVERYAARGNRALYFGEYLVQVGRITHEQLLSVLRVLKLEQARGVPLRVGDALVQLGLVERDTVEGLKEQYDELLAERGGNSVS